MKWTRGLTGIPWQNRITKNRNITEKIIRKIKANITIAGLILLNTTFISWKELSFTQEALIVAIIIPLLREVPEVGFNLTMKRWLSLTLRICRRKLLEQNKDNIRWKMPTSYFINVSQKTIIRSGLRNKV